MAKRILVVEDSPSYAKALTFLLQKAGYEAFVAIDGPKGVNKAKKENPDLVILDVLMPGMDGFEVCSRLRADPATSATPILMLSSKDHKDDLATAEEVGADDFFVKPVDNSVLLGRIESLLQKIRQSG